MPAPTFNLPIAGAAPNQYANEDSFEAALNAVLQALLTMIENSSNRGDTLVPVPVAGGTAQAASFTIDPTQSHVTTSVGTLVRFQWPVTNTGPDPIATIAAEAFTLKRANGSSFAAGEVGGGNRFLGLIQNTTPREIRIIGALGLDDIFGLRDLIFLVAQTIAEAVQSSTEQSWPGDGVVLAEGSNGKALVTRSNGQTRGTFLADDVFAGIYSELLRAGEGDQIRDRVLNDGWPGDEGEVLALGLNGVALAYDRLGRLLGGIVTPRSSGWPGDWISEEVVDARGVVVFGHDVRDGSDYSLALDVSGWPGDWIIGLEFDRAGRILRGIDKRDQSSYPAGQSGGGTGGGSVEFVDPGFSGDAFGAVIDSDGVVKFTTIVAPGRSLGMEKREGRFFADTQKLAIAVLAIGGGDTGAASSIEDHRWHVFDETLEPQDTQTAASGLASAILTRQRNAYEARALMFPIAEVIGSTVETDVLAGEPRRIQLMTRLQAAVDATASWGKDLMVGWIKLDLLDGAPGTLQATAREHYGLVANGLRLEAVEVTRQAAFPRPMVNQGFGTRTDGTSEVILAEGRLDWDFFSLGFIVPTPLYPFELVAGSPASLTPAALLMVREIEALAIAELALAREWFCPSLEEATLSGSTITARFATLSGLVIRDPANHGFTLTGSSPPAITGVTVSGGYATITLAAAPTGGVTLNYAFGRSGDPGDGKPANRGSITDSWSQASAAVPGQTLYRFARSGRVTVN